MSVLIALQLLSCSPEFAAFMEGFAEGVQNTQKAKRDRGCQLMIFGGRGHEVYLGCLSGSRYSTESVFNRYGAYGSAYSSTSIRNKYSDYGSRYSQYSACNPYASDPPVVVDYDGNYYGCITVNKYGHDRYGDGEFNNWLEHVVCGD